ncbi:MAG TPA: hypothetical protein VNA26_08585 [Chitinophagaceae bacterium]|nr:hypothetical protein [Chitinophagaceae bacterium]
MATSKNQPNQQENDDSKQTRGGDTSRTSSQGRKESSGGSKETNNQGRPKGDNPQNDAGRSKRC